MGIFGTLNPKIVSGVTTCNFDYSVLIKSEPEYDIEIHQNPVNIDRNIIYYGAYWTFIIRDYLYKYGVPATKYAAIKALLNTNVYLWFDRNYDPFKSPAGTTVNFNFAEMQEITLRDTDCIQALDLTFLSTGYISPSELTYEYLIREREEDEILTEDGQQILLG